MNADSKPLASGWSIDRRELILGVSLVLLTFLMPLLFNVRSFAVYDHLNAALRLREKTELMFAAYTLVMLNALRCLPHYIGVFFIGDSLGARRLKGYQGVLSAALGFVLLLLTYGGIELVHGIHYDFGLPAVFVSLFAIVFGALRFRVSLLKKALMISLALIPLQFMDIAPALDRLPVGRGETSTDIKLAAQLLDAEDMLNSLGMFGMTLFLFFAIIVLLLLREESAFRQLSQLRVQNEEMRAQARINEIRTRGYEEIQFLVHDFKSPLTTIQTIVDVIRMEHEGEESFNDGQYLERIEYAVGSMSGMLSELCHEDRLACVDTKHLADKALSQASATEYAPYLHAENTVPEDRVNANRIYFTRVLLNLMQNAAQAIPKGRTPEIWLRVSRREDADGTKILFSVSDNGKGIPPEDREKIWSKGVSGKGSSGMGLAFVQSVVEGMGGVIELSSEVGVGTTFTIVLRQEGDPE